MKGGSIGFPTAASGFYFPDRKESLARLVHWSSPSTANGVMVLLFPLCYYHTMMKNGTLKIVNVYNSGESNSESLCRTEPNRTFPISNSAEPNRTELFGQNFAELFGKPNRTIK